MRDDGAALPRTDIAGHFLRDAKPWTNANNANDVGTHKSNHNG
jgi:hypothetical protein